MTAGPALLRAGCASAARHPPPRPLDTRTPGSLREKAQLAQSHNCAELNFYAYGLYRLQSLDQIRHALFPRGAKSPAG